MMIRALLLSAVVSMSAAADVSAPVRKLLDKMEEAQGGKEAVAKVKSLKVVLNGEMPDLGMKMIVTTVSDLNRVYVKSEIPGAMTSVQAYDGKNAWANDMLLGLRDLKGPEKSALISSTLKAANSPEAAIMAAKVSASTAAKAVAVSSPAARMRLNARYGFAAGSAERYSMRVARGLARLAIGTRMSPLRLLRAHEMCTGASNPGTSRLYELTVWLVIAVISAACRSRPAMNDFASGDRRCGSSPS